jgi:cytochrome c-type biogenesis protein CcmF
MGRLVVLGSGGERLIHAVAGRARSVHSLAVTEKRGGFKSWTVLLAICAFSLSLLGTFLVRSGVLTSVHAFATDPRRGIFILIFLALVIGGSLLLFAWRAPRVGLGGGFAVVSRESMLLANNLLLLVAAGSVLLGTLYPLFLDALDLGKISVGPPYFDSVFVPLMTPALFLMGVGPLARWKQAELPELAVRLKWALVVSLFTALALPFALGTWKPLVSFGLALALWILITAGINLKSRLALSKGSLTSRLCAATVRVLRHVACTLRRGGVHHRRNTRQRLRNRARRAHGGGRQRDRGPLRVSLRRRGQRGRANYRAARGHVTVLRDGTQIMQLQPEKRIYNAQQQAMTEAAIATGLFGDLYVALGEPVGDDAWSVRVYDKPFVTWVWGGCIIMALGGLLALSDRRYRRTRALEAERLAAGQAPQRT